MPMGDFEGDNGKQPVIYDLRCQRRQMATMEIPADPPPEIQRVVKSWVGVVQKKQNEKVEGSKEKGKSGGAQEGSEMGNMEERCSEDEGNKEIEEGEITGWEKVAGEKIGRSPISQSLMYGQVTIATPSRFAALRNTNEKGEEIDEEQTEEMEEMDKEEEVEDIYQSRAEESLVGVRARHPVGVRAGYLVGVRARSGTSSRSESWLPSRSES
ncbi:LOW QUALITY PROTEIN: hypothetical protein HID58_008698 [Brassica napus]|uniref:Uncharacterized protein n=1 Tax=Brassica napus TaxID=3708 RepID=A0ABQ8DT03_BRANA|nr:LOW QUALITY PROTEIN: hypothetical protein HID58_008698 [Brassica napus]